LRVFGYGAGASLMNKSLRIILILARQAPGQRELEHPGG
jgi:hypothetical protein